MDASRYAGSGFLTLADVEEGPVRGEVAKVQEGNYGKLVLTFSNGLKLSLNTTNCTEMIKQLGSETNDWFGAQVELTKGETLYQGNMVPSIRLAVLPRDPNQPKPQPPPQSSRGDMDDEIPF